VTADPQTAFDLSLAPGTVSTLCREVLLRFYPEDTPLRRLLLKHSFQVRAKALAIAKAAPEVRADLELVSDGAMLHDVGICRCHAPGILCEGEAPYIAHGIIGAEMLRSCGIPDRERLAALARICERHTGSGLTAEDIRSQNLPIPEGEYLPETPEEKLICLADKFFSKSGDMQEKPFSKVQRSMAKFGADSAARFEALCRFWKYGA